MTDHIDRGLECMLALEGMSDREKLYEALGQAYACGGAVWMPAVEGCLDCVRRDMNRHPAYVYWSAKADETAFDEDNMLRAPLRMHHAGEGAPVLALYIGDVGLIMAWNGNLREDFEVVSRSMVREGEENTT